MEKKKIQIIVLIILITILAAYGFYQLTGKQNGKQKENKRLPQPISTLSTQKPSQAEDIPKVSIYDAYNLKDPFYPQIVRKATLKGASPLQQYDIEELKVTGIIKDGNIGYKGLIRTPDGRHFVVKENDKIGIYGGQITKISKEGLEIKETTRSHTGELLQTTKTLKLRTEEGR